MPIHLTDRLREPLPWPEQKTRALRPALAQLLARLAEVQAPQVAAEVAQPVLRPSNLLRVGSGGAVPRIVPRCGCLHARYEFAAIARRVPRCGDRRLLPERNPAVSRASVHAAVRAAGSLPASRSLSASVHNWRKDRRPSMTG